MTTSSFCWWFTNFLFHWLIQMMQWALNMLYGLNTKQWQNFLSIKEFNGAICDGYDGERQSYHTIFIEIWEDRDSIINLTLPIMKKCDEETLQSIKQVYLVLPSNTNTPFLQQLFLSNLLDLQEVFSSLDGRCHVIQIKFLQKPSWVQIWIMSSVAFQVYCIWCSTSYIL